MNILKTILIIAAAGLLLPAHARTLHLDSLHGNDSNDGKTEETAWRSLTKANGFEFKPGDRLRLKRNSRFTGGLTLTLKGTPEQPVVIEAYGEGNAPFINAKGYFAGVSLQDSCHVTVRDLEITADGGKTMDGSKPNERYGVVVRGVSSHVTIEDLFIYNIFPEVGSGNEGANAKTFMGSGIDLEGIPDTPCEHFVVRNCRIERTGYKAIRLQKIQHVQILDNTMKDIGGPAIQPGRVDNLLVRGNTVDGSGSNLDPRMHARGSGIWPWGSNNVLIEKNSFMHARGKGDSCGIHIDYNCRNVIVQYNLSNDNEGGFAEILGNNHNCAYRYNISINDGARRKGIDGAHQEGKILWTSGFVGGRKARSGPYNSYIYNNTIYVKEGSRSCFSLMSSTRGLLIANNIFYILGSTEDVAGDQTWRGDKIDDSMERAVIENNLYVSRSSWPLDLSFREKKMTIGDPQFANPGGFNAEDYIPQNARLIQNRGIQIKRLEGDDIGLTLGLEVKEDFFGNPIIGKSDLGAIEIGSR